MNTKWCKWDDDDYETSCRYFFFVLRCCARLASDFRFYHKKSWRLKEEAQLFKIKVGTGAWYDPDQKLLAGCEFFVDSSAHLYKKGLIIIIIVFFAAALTLTCSLNNSELDVCTYVFE